VTTIEDEDQRAQRRYEDNCRAYIRRYYSVPADRGGRIRYTGDGGPREGTIVGFVDSYLSVVLDGDDGIAQPFHPTWEIEYL
jgi:hypothetical protein